MAINTSHFKLVLLGDPDVGKTSILLRYTDNTFSELTSTQPVSEKLKKIRINGRDMVLEIWDTAGQERYKSLETHYYRDADAALLVYNIVDEESFTSVCDYWLKETQRYLPDEAVIPIQLVCNKSDLISTDSSVDDYVPFDDVKEYADAYGILQPIQCSAKTGHNINKIFNVIASELYKTHLLKVDDIENCRKVSHNLSEDTSISSCCFGDGGRNK